MRHLLDVLLGIGRRHWRALLIYHLLFSTAVAALLLPLGAGLLGLVAANTVQLTVDAVGLLEVLASPGGWLWLLVVLFAVVSLAVIQQAGMLGAIRAGQSRGPYRSALAGLWHALRHARPLLAVAAILAAVLLVLSLPVAAVGTFAYEALLGHFDNYYVRLARPPELLWFIALATGLGLLWLAAVGWLYLHWLLVLPLIVFDDYGAVAALRASWCAMAGSRGAATGNILLLGGSALLLPPLATFGLEWVGARILALVPTQLAWVVPVMLLYMTVVLALTILAAFAGTALHAGLLVALHERASGHRVAMAPEPAETGRLLWSAEALLLVVTVGQVYFLLPELDTRDQVQVTAHRGSSIKAPENTLPAIEQAVVDGADAVEIDVRRTADGRLVLWHDSDLLRLGGRDRAVNEVTFETLRGIDIGAALDPRFLGTRVATLHEAVDTLRGRAEIYVDVKRTPDSRGLTQDVVALLQAEGVVAQSAILSSRPSVLAAARQLAPGLKRVQLAEFVLGELDRNNFDALALRQNRVAAAEVARARRPGYELHVWTVNDPAAMERFIDLGVDNIITDRPEILANRLAERAAMSTSERLLVRLHNWHRW